MAFATINKPSNYFDTKLYTGTGSTQSVTGLNFSPDFTWIKNRTAVTAPVVYDAVRGATKDLYTSATDAEGTNANGVTSFNSDGFSVGSSGGVNGNTQNIVSWNWDANGAGVSNTSGTITSTVSANTTSGFSIVSYTGTGSNATVGHGLGVAPKMIIFKSRNSATSWVTYHASLGATNFVALSNTDASSASSLPFNNTAPTSTVFSLGTSGGTNSTSMIAYCFAEVKGFSKIGSYTGNGSTDGTFVYTGFKPAWIMIRRTDIIENWNILDAKRSATNGYNNASLYANSSASETVNSTWTLVDLLSNGFKQRYTDNLMNGSGGTYIYAAFAEQPLVGTNNVPATAR